MFKPDASTNNEYHRLVSYSAPVSVPQISVELLISGGEPENEAIRRSRLR